MKKLPAELYELTVSFYRKSTRNVPWRKQITPYSIWLSEIMCQQTRMESVIPYYYAFLEKAPDLLSLAKLNEDEVNKLWQGLGYYSRARNLQKAAKLIVDEYQGIFPSHYEDILRLPGVGEYSAGAIASIAFKEKKAAIDGNALRVLTRVNADSSDITLPKTKVDYKNSVEAILGEDPGDFNQGIMDIGALFCLPHGKPLCKNCPLNRICLAHQKGNEEAFPIKNKKIVKKEEDLTLFLVKEDGKILLHKRDEKGLLASLYEFKNVPGKLNQEEASSCFGMTLVSIQKKESRDFTFTHKIWHMSIYLIHTKGYVLEPNEIWVNEKELNETYSLPSAFAQFLSLLK